MLLWNQTWCGPAAEYPVTGGVSLTWAQTDNVCCVPDRQMAFSTHKLRSHKIRSALTKLHTYIHAYDTDGVRQSHTASHIMRLIWKEWEKSCSLSLSLSHTCKHMLWLMGTLAHIFMVTHTVHKAVPLHAHWWSATYFIQLSCSRSHKSHTQSRQLVRHLLSTFNPDTRVFTTYHTKLNPIVWSEYLANRMW